MPSLIELKETRAAKVDELRKIDFASGDEARKRFDDLDAEVRTLSGDILRAEKLAEAERNAHAVELPKEVRSRYSVAKAILEAMDRRLTGIEAETHQELAKGRECRGVMIPSEFFLGETRAQTASEGPKGGYLVPQQMQPVADIFRPALMVESMGATVLRGLVGNIDLPILTGSGTAQWVSDNGAATTTDASFGSAAMSPRTVTAQYELSRRLLINATSAEVILRRDLAALLATALDKAALQGAVAPVGLFNSGITKVTTETMGSPAVTDFAATVANLVHEVDNANVPRTARGLLGSPKIARAMRKTKDADLHSIPFLELTGGERFEVSTQVPDTLSTNKSGLAYGEWPELFVGNWSGVDLLANPYSDTVSSKGGLLLHAFLDADVIVRRTAAFAYAEI